MGWAWLAGIEHVLNDWSRPTQLEDGRLWLTPAGMGPDEQPVMLSEQTEKLMGKYENPWGQMQPTPPVGRANTVLKRPSPVQNEDGPTA